MIEIWLSPLLISVILVPVVLYVGYHHVVPRLIVEGYRRELTSQKFRVVDGSEGAGSVDIKYYNLYFDVRNQDVVISGQAPDARYWQFGAFDGATRLIDGAFLNHKTVQLNEDMTFRIRLTVDPKSDQLKNVLDCSACPRGMVIFRIVLPQQEVELPAVELTSSRNR